MKRKYFLLILLCFCICAMAQEQRKTVTFWDEYFDEPYTGVVSCFDANHKDLILDVFENAFPLTDERGNIHLHDIEKIKTVVMTGCRLDTVDVSNGVPDTIRINHGDWPPYKFLGYYVPEQTVADTTFIRGLNILAYNGDTLKVSIRGGYDGEKLKKWFGGYAFMKGDSTLRFECNGLGLELLFRQKGVFEFRPVRPEDAPRMKDLVEGCPLKPCVYKRIASNVVKRKRPRMTSE